MGFNKAHKMAQRLHRERRQPEHRRKMGYLEKKQDYKKRALDHHTKAERIKKLKAKALQRNPNEFHFHMINSRVVDGVHYDIRKPMEPEIRQKLIKKEELLKRYNDQVLLRRKLRRKFETAAKIDDEDNSEEEDHLVSGTSGQSNRRKVPKHIIFNKT